MGSRLRIILATALAAAALSAPVSAPAQSPAARASVAGALPPTAEGPRLLLRHVTATGAAREAAPVRVLVGEPPEPLAVDVVGTPLVASGETARVRLVIDGSTAPPEELARRRDGIVQAVQQTFQPGDLFAVTFVDRNTTPAEPVWLSDLPSIERAIAAGFDGQGAPLDTAAVLEQVGGAAPDDGLAEDHVEVVLFTPFDRVDTSAFGSQWAAARNLSVSAALYTAEPGAGGDAAACRVAGRTGGVCHVAAPEGAGEQAMAQRAWPDAARRALDEAQSLFVTPIDCAAEVDGGDARVWVELGADASEPRPVPAAWIACSTWEPTVIEGSGAPAGPPPEPPPTPMWVWGAAGGGGVLLLAFVGLLLTRRRPGTVEGSPFDAFAPLESPAASGAPVDDQPSWLRDPSLHSVRESLRQHAPQMEGWHVAFASGPVVHELPLRPGEPITIGNAGRARLRVGSIRDGAIAVRLAIAGDGVQLQRIDQDVACERNGDDCPAACALVPGDELCVGGVVIELRRVDPEGVRSPAQARTVARFVPAADEAFASFLVDTTSVVLGRDPLPYRGVTPHPARLRIPPLSGDHVELWISGGVLYARDLGSSNGTELDGARLDAGRVVAVPRGGTLTLASLVTFSVDGAG